MKKRFLAAVASLALLLGTLVSFSPALAADPATNQNDPSVLLGQTKLGGSVSDTANTLPVIIGSIVKVALGFVGVIFVLLMLYAGFNWMTAAGDEGKVETAKQTLQRAIIGLIIVISAYAITSFVITRVQSAATNGGCAPGVNAPGCQ